MLSTALQTLYFVLPLILGCNAVQEVVATPPAQQSSATTKPFLPAPTAPTQKDNLQAEERLQLQASEQKEQSEPGAKQASKKGKKSYTQQVVQEAAKRAQAFLRPALQASLRQGIRAMISTALFCLVYNFLEDKGQHDWKQFALSQLLPAALVSLVLESSHHLLEEVFWQPLHLPKIVRLALGPMLISLTLYCGWGWLPGLLLLMLGAALLHNTNPESRHDFVVKALSGAWVAFATFILCRIGNLALHRWALHPLKTLAGVGEKVDYPNLLEEVYLTRHYINLIYISKWLQSNSLFVLVEPEHNAKPDGTSHVGYLAACITGHESLKPRVDKLSGWLGSQRRADAVALNIASYLAETIGHYLPYII